VSTLLHVAIQTRCCYGDAFPHLRFPGMLTNDLASGFQVLQLFLAAKHGNRAAPGHKCEYPDLPELASQPRVCHVCGWEEYKLSKQELTHLERSFAQWDKDGSGELDSTEIAPLLRCLGKAPTRAVLERIMKFMDVDGNGSISFTEFVDGLTKGEELSYGTAVLHSRSCDADVRIGVQVSRQKDVLVFAGVCALPVVGCHRSP